MSEIENLVEQLSHLKTQLQQQVVGQEHAGESLLLALLADGHVLLEGLPGTAKTRSVKALSKLLGVDMGRVQFTPDLLPSDVIGYEALAGTSVKFNPGPVFSNILLADEINRAPPKVQSALLEAMEERQVTVAGDSHKLDQLFTVLATQNPIEQEGTYPLPEAQMDRFLMKVTIDYPDAEGELAIVHLVHREEKPQPLHAIESARELILKSRIVVRDIHISEAAERYLVALVIATREPERYPDSALSRWIKIGASPRASIALHKAARAHALLNGKDFVDPDNIRAVALPILGHRVALSYEAQAEGIGAREVIEEILQTVPVE